MSNYSLHFYADVITYSLLHESSWSRVDLADLYDWSYHTRNDICPVTSKVTIYFHNVNSVMALTIIYLQYLVIAFVIHMIKFMSSIYVLRAADLYLAYIQFPIFTL